MCVRVCACACVRVCIHTQNNLKITMIMINPLECFLASETM